MITVIHPNSNVNADGIDHVLIRECGCTKRVCCTRLLFGILCFAGLVGVIVYVTCGARCGHEATFALASFAVLLGVFTLLTTMLSCRCVVYRPTGSRMHKRILYFDAADLADLATFLTTGQRAEDADGSVHPLPRALANGNVLLEAAMADDESMALVRVMRYEGFGYVMTDLQRMFTGADARRVIRFVKQSAVN